MEKGHKENVGIYREGDRRVMPKISIVIPTYGRSDKLKQLLKKIEEQTFHDFEVVVIIDGGDTNIEEYEKICPYSLKVKKIQNCGCNQARNVGIKQANASIIAFTDDDCLPDPTWLENGIQYFDDKRIIGIEGYIYSERKGNATHRTPQITERKHNITRGKTANMFYRKEILEEINGFDKEFSVRISRGIIGFRGDTDIAWRAEKKGAIPFAHDVRVYHPVDKTTLKKELKNSNSFAFTALLLKKHPDRLNDIVWLTLFPITPSTPLKIFWFFLGIIFRNVYSS
jgi:glycosyltransferase involved in cell wall biosynthesis